MPEAVTGAETPHTALTAALELHAAGLNVFPQPLAQKGGMPWKLSRYTRLGASDLPEVFAGRCNVAVMTGRTSGGLFVLDCESESAFDRVLFELRARRIPLWAVQTARGGHVYLRSSASPVANVPAGRIPAIEVRGQGCYVLAPPSIHPTGVVYAWLERDGAAPPVVHPAQIDFLTDSAGAPVLLEYRRPGAGAGALRLNSATRRYLSDGHTLAEGERHTAFFRACCNFRDVGFTVEDMERELVPIARASGLPGAGDKQELARIMQWAEQNVQPKGRAHTGLPNAAAFDWPGRTGRTDAAVFAALIVRAQLGSYGGGAFRGTYLELMPLAAVASEHTLRRALARLIARQLIERAGQDTEMNGSLWRFGPAATANTKTEKSGGGGGGVRQFTATAAKSAESAALGYTPREVSSAALSTLFQPTERRILAAIEGAPTPLRTMGDVAKAAELPVGQVKSVLRLEGFLRTSRAIVKQAGAWHAGAVDMLIVQERADKAEAKRRRIKRRAERERARRAAQFIIRWRVAHDAHYYG